MDSTPTNFIKLRLLSFVSGLIFLLLTPVVCAGDSSRSWCEVKDDYIVVEDKLFDYIVSFTKNKGKRHFLYTVVMVESRMNPYSQRGFSGEFGMMQMMPKTGEFLERLKKQKLDVSTVKDNVYAALFYLDFILEKIDKYCPESISLNAKVQVAAAAYNGGVGHLAEGCSVDSYNISTRNYAKRFLKYWKKLYFQKQL